MTSNELAAVRLLGVNTHGTFDPWNLGGPSRARIRAEIMTLLAGRRVPQAKAGVLAIRDAFYALGDIPRWGCIAVTQDAFRAWCLEVIQ